MRMRGERYPCDEGTGRCYSPLYASYPHAFLHLHSRSVLHSLRSFHTSRSGAEGVRSEASGDGRRPEWGEGGRCEWRRLGLSSFASPSHSFSLPTRAPSLSLSHPCRPRRDETRVGVKRAESHPQPDPPFSLHITRLSSPHPASHSVRRSFSSGSLPPHFVRSGWNEWRTEGTNEWKTVRTKGGGISVPIYYLFVFSLIIWES